MVPLAQPAVVSLAFDPTLRIGDAGVRLQTIGIAVAILLALIVAARLAAKTPVGLLADGSPAPAPPDEVWHLRRDDLFYVVLGSLPGAILGGRLGYVLLHLDFYRANPGAIVDPTQGGLQLSLGLLGAVISGWLVAGLLDAPPGRWLHLATIPTLLAIGIGKAALALGGDGQGLPSDAPWATAYVTPGPWGSLGPALPSHPAQLYEAIATGLVLLVVLVALAGGAFHARDGRLFWTAIALWAGARAVIASVWRDPVEIGGLRVDQAISLALVALSLLIVAVGTVRRRRRGTRALGDVVWPDPATRPRF